MTLYYRYWEDDELIPPTKFEYKLLSAPTKQELVDHHYSPIDPEALTYLVRRVPGEKDWFPVRTDGDETVAHKLVKFPSALEAKLYVEKLQRRYQDDYSEWMEAAVAYAEDVRDAAIAEANKEFEMTKYRIMNEHGKVIE